MAKGRRGMIWGMVPGRDAIGSVRHNESATLTTRETAICKSGDLRQTLDVFYNQP